MSEALEEIATQATAEPTSEYLSFADLQRKPRRSISFDVTTIDEEGHPHVGKMKFVGLPPKEYDDLVAAYPPSGREKAMGAAYDADTFTPALIAAVSNQPRLSVEQVKDLIESGSWSSGEAMSLFLYAQRACNAGIDVPFNDRG